MFFFIFFSLATSRKPGGIVPSYFPTKSFTNKKNLCVKDILLSDLLIKMYALLFNWWPAELNNVCCKGIVFDVTLWILSQVKQNTVVIVHVFPLTPSKHWYKCEVYFKQCIFSFDIIFRIKHIFYDFVRRVQSLST